MIKYSLICDQEHNFEAWFSDYDTCEKQLEESSVECPLCGSKKISKSIMAPNIPSKSNQKAPKSDVKNSGLNGLFPKISAGITYIAIFDLLRSYISSRLMPMFLVTWPR